MVLINGCGVSANGVASGDHKAILLLVVKNILRSAGTLYGPKAMYLTGRSPKKKET